MSHLKHSASMWARLSAHYAMCYNSLLSSSGVSLVERFCMLFTSSNFIRFMEDGQDSFADSRVICEIDPSQFTNGLVSQL
mmetsp:Transcript_5343/g.7702  ORF Transcript_5343/g.7702 Transcript_5343/m.7702 type:complete len:80 (+) Transcript_5343:263-502(+)